MPQAQARRPQGHSNANANANAKVFFHRSLITYKSSSSSTPSTFAFLLRGLSISYSSLRFLPPPAGIAIACLPVSLASRNSLNLFLASSSACAVAAFVIANMGPQRFIW